MRNGHEKKKKKYSNTVYGFNYHINVIFIKYCNSSDTIDLLTFQHTAP